MVLDFEVTHYQLVPAGSPLQNALVTPTLDRCADFSDASAHLGALVTVRRINWPQTFARLRVLGTFDAIGDYADYVPLPSSPGPSRYLRRHRFHAHNAESTCRAQIDLLQDSEGNSDLQGDLLTVEQQMLGFPVAKLATDHFTFENLPIDLAKSQWIGGYDDLSTLLGCALRHETFKREFWDRAEFGLSLFQLRA